MSTASVDMKTRGQQDAIFNCDWAMRERGDEQLVPPWTGDKCVKCDWKQNHMDWWIHFSETQLKVVGDKRSFSNFYFL